MTLGTWENAAANARKDCPQCKGTGLYMYDHNHGTICDLCCQHNMGFWHLKDHYGPNNGKWCCRAGCGKVYELNPMPQTPSYRIFDYGNAILCHVCGKPSWSAGDVQELYCGNCKRFHVKEEA